MLSRENTIKTLRMLCKALTGRTSATPMTTINKALRPFSEHYTVQITDSVRKSSSIAPGYCSLEARSPLVNIAGRPTTVRRGIITFPCSIFAAINQLVAMDAQAEQDYQCGYGGQRGS